MEDGIVTSEGAESVMRASLRNNIRRRKPKKMLKKVFLTHRAGFLHRQEDAENCDSPVPIIVEKNIAALIRHTWNYQDTVRFTECTRKMKATTVSVIDGSVRRRLKFPAEEYVNPSCCGYSQNGEGYPCYHRIAVL